MKASRTPRLISYRLSLMITISLLVVATGGLIIGNSYARTRDAVSRLGGRLFREVSEHVVMQTRQRLGAAVPATELIRERMHDHLLPGDDATMSREFLAMLRANPEFSWVSYGDASGAFTSAFRTPDGIVRVNHSVQGVPHGRVIEQQIDASGRWLPFRDEASDYDPRTRPWYRLAATETQRVWTPPYVFFHESLPGITCSSPNRSPAGELLGVITVDFDLYSLSAFVARLHPSAGGRVFIFTRDGTLIAHPSEPVVRRATPDSTPALVNVRDARDPLVRGFVDSVRSRHAIGTARGASADFDEEFAFDVNGIRYLASYNSFRVDGQLDWVVAAIAPESDLMDGVHRGNLMSLLISLAGLAVALLVGAALAQRIAGPLTDLAAEMEEVGRFNIKDRTARSTFLREMDMMYRALASMKLGLRSFANYVPRDLVRAVLASGQEAVLGGKTRTLTVFFSDLANFTSIAEQMNPDELSEFLGGYLDEMTRTIAVHHGTVDKFIGDGIMAFWGAPEDNEDHAALACEAALGCIRRLQAMRDAGDGPTQLLRERIGLCTGEVVVGNIGTPARMNYTVIGDVVNVASRLENLNKVYGTTILVAEQTMQRAGSRVVTRPIDMVAVKGKARATMVYELLCLSSEADDGIREVVRLSEAALAAYVAREFKTAAELFEAVIAIRAADGAATVMAQRSRAYAESPPPAGWNGVFVATTK